MWILRKVMGLYLQKKTIVFCKYLLISYYKGFAFDFKVKRIAPNTSRNEWNIRKRSPFRLPISSDQWTFLSITFDRRDKTRDTSIFIISPVKSRWHTGQVNKWSSHVFEILNFSTYYFRTNDYLQNKKKSNRRTEAVIHLVNLLFFFFY